MVYKRFTLQVLIRVLLLLAVLTLLAFIFPDKRLLFVQVILLLLVAGQIYELIHFVTLTNRELSKLLLAIKHHDFSIHFPKSKLNRSFEGLYEAFRQIIKAYQEVKVEREAQFQYMRMIVRHIDFGIIAFDDKGEVVLMNNHACSMLQINHVKYWRILQQRLPAFAQTVETMPAEESLIYTLGMHQENLRLLLRKSEVTLLGVNYYILTFKNIRSEIEQTEAVAWHKLIRVLTHEIMNTVTPIASLTETMLMLVEHDGKPVGAANLTDEHVDDMRQSLRMINERSQGIMHFVADYRKLTRLPKPKPQLIDDAELLNGMAALMGPELQRNNIKLHLTTLENTNLLADRNLVEQVLINIVTNAMQAVADQPHPTIQLAAVLDHGSLCLSVTDNGPGIADDKLEKIFIPFYTTKQQGSGIGLSLSRQIMALHKGELLLRTKQGHGATFVLRFREADSAIK